MAKFEVYEDQAGEYRFRLVASNGQIVCWSEGYTQKQSAINAAAWVRTNAPGAPIHDLTV